MIAEIQLDREAFGVYAEVVFGADLVSTASWKVDLHVEVGLRAS